MPRDSSSEITTILRDWNAGKTDAPERLLPYVYAELRQQARMLMSRERANHTLQPTALVHEAFMRIGASAGVDWQNRGHFYAIATRIMRQILVDHARRRAAGKRGSSQILIGLDDLQIPIEHRSDAILAVNEALDRLGELDEQQARIVEMRFFGGMNNSDIAESLGISERTVGRELRSAKLWLFRELRGNA